MKTAKVTVNDKKTGYVIFENEPHFVNLLCIFAEERNPPKKQIVEKRLGYVLKINCCVPNINVLRPFFL